MSNLRDGEFFLGRLFNMEQNKLTDQPLMYDPADLVTHGIITGMTGSGKTGLGIGILEEAAMEGIPAIVVDPKGDLTNLLLHFPDLLPSDFEPWIDPDTARREGKTISQQAEETASLWAKGLADWGLGREQLAALKEVVDFGVYTPGSTAGTPVNILSSFAAPDLPWEDNREILREKISTIVTALLGLIGLPNIDPLRSREHILLSNILEHAWSKEKSIDITEMIVQTQKPPFEHLGALSVNSFFPEKDRFELAMLLNNFLASPSFEVWREGQALDLNALLYSPSGKPRHSIFYLAHLSESERMFFVTLLFASIESWMRAQRGTSALRALIYFDEILGYLPPEANAKPPSRVVMLRMLKQARAFGVGLLLATQNPIDVDYKGLSNAGTWMIGRLQTDPDKQRLLDGLDSAGGGLDRREVDTLISRLGKRTFLLHNVHAKKAQVFQTRWALNYLAGPLTRSQIPALMKLLPEQEAASAAPAGRPVGAAAAAAAPATVAPSGERLSTSRPAIPSGVEEYFIPNDQPFGEAISAGRIPSDAQMQQGGIVYRAGMFAQAEIAYLSPRYNLNLTRQMASLAQEARGRRIAWEDFAWHAYRREQLTGAPLPGARFAALPAWVGDARQIAGFQSDFQDWVYRASAINLRVNETLKVYAGPEISTAEFKEMCAKAARNAMQAEIDKVDYGYQKKLADLERKIKRQEMDVDSQQDELGQRRMEEGGKVVETLFGVLGGRRRSISSNLTKRRMTSQAKAQLKQEEAELEALEKQLESLEAERRSSIDAIKERWGQVVEREIEVPVTPYKKDIYVDLFGVAWMPYYVITVGSQTRELPAFTG